MKIVVDTNVLVSALIKKGPPRDLLFKLGQDSEDLILSREILEEFLDVVEDEKSGNMLTKKT